MWHTDCLISHTSQVMNSTDERKPASAQGFLLFGGLLLGVMLVAYAIVRLFQDLS